jgi:hypothetical protein
VNELEIIWKEEVFAQSKPFCIFLKGLRKLMRNLRDDNCCQPVIQGTLSVYLKTSFQLHTLKAVSNGKTTVCVRNWEKAVGS